MSPVPMLKQAPCQGQVIRPSPVITPLIKGAPKSSRQLTSLSSATWLYHRDKTHEYTWVPVLSADH